MSALRVIVADDDRDTVTTLTELLRDEGHQVRAVYRGSDVLREVLDFDPDAVLLDIGLPEVPGHVVARKIRECCGHRRPLLIGINHYLIKPCDPNSLIALLAPLQASS